VNAIPNVYLDNDINPWEGCRGVSMDLISHLFYVVVCFAIEFTQSSCFSYKSGSIWIPIYCT
jgi:hypothetical protein